MENGNMISFTVFGIGTIVGIFSVIVSAVVLTVLENKDKDTYLAEMWYLFCKVLTIAFLTVFPLTYAVLKIIL